MLQLSPSFALLGFMAPPYSRTPLRLPVRAPPPSAGLLDALRDRAETTHAQECADAALNFPAHSDISDCSFADDDFVTHRVEPQVRAGPDLAGPDASRLRGATHIHQTVRPILSDEEIGALRAEASAAISSGLQSNFTYTQENKLGEVHTADLPVAREWLTRRLHDTLYPMLSERYDLDPTKLRVFDSLIINYDASRGAVRQVLPSAERLTLGTWRLALGALRSALIISYPCM